MGVTVLVSGRVPLDRLASLQVELPEVSFRYFAEESDLDQVVEVADIVAGHLSPEAFGRAGRLKWVHTWAAGPDRALFPAMVASPIPLTSSKGNGAIPLAEHSMLLMLMLAGGADRWFEAQRQHDWAPHPHRELSGSTCGIVGLGNAGVELARRLQAFGTNVIGMRRTTQPASYVDEIYRPDELERFLTGADFVVVTAPLTGSTRHLFGEREFRWMKPSAYFICISRGGIADDVALLRALQEGWIAGAGLDAHGVEPLPPDSPFWTAPHTIVTPHSGSASPRTVERGFDIFEANLRRFLTGQPLANLVDKAAGY